MADATTETQPAHVVAIFGGACSGSVAAEILAEKGVQVVVFEQNPRPYGKIEDGLPRWHKDQRRMEYGKIDERIDRANVTYVPNTKLGQDVSFQDVLGWGFSAVLLANGAWRDRPLVADGVDEALASGGLVYQNPFIYWFNHKDEASYDGPEYAIHDGTVVVGGGLASIDVIKVLQLELYARALRERGVEPDMYEMEHAGIPKYCAAHGIQDPGSLGVKGAVLVYRRRVEDMPLAKVAKARQKILAKVQRNFLFEFKPQLVTKELKSSPQSPPQSEGGQLKSIVLFETEIDENGRAQATERTVEIETPMVISSIGSIPEPIKGIEMKGTYYKYKDWDTGEYEPVSGVYGLGNVVTGQGNIKASLDHGKQVANHLIENYLGVSEDGERDLSEAFDKQAAKGEAGAEAVAEHLEQKTPLPADKVAELLGKARARQQEVGYTEGYRAWIDKVTPPDFV